MAEQQSVQSLDRAFDLLERLCHSRGGMSIAQLSAETGLHKSTVHRLLASMMQRGYVMQDPSSSAYHAGMRLCELSGYIMENLDVVGRARLPMEQLSRTTEETVHLVMQEGEDIVYVHKVESLHGAIRMFSRIGMRRPLFCTGVGKAILATWPDEEVLDYWHAANIRPFTEHTIVTEQAFLREIAHIRREGVAYDNEENELGVRCIATAVPDWRGRAVYALSISAPLSRMPNERMAELKKPLLACRSEIAAMLGG